MPQTRIGISGWRYGPWRGTFYPKGLAQRLELNFAASRLNSIEINGSFYSLQRPEYYTQWYDDTPADFLFSLKGGRYITHLRRLKDVRVPLANFLASGVLALNEKLGPILWQFPPMMSLDLERFEAFFDLLPRDTESAAALAQEHDKFLKKRAWAQTDRRRPLRHAVEVRHESFADPAFVRLCRRHDVAIVFADTAGKWPYIEDVTAADFVYARLHGDKELYVSGYDDAALDWWAARFDAWRAGREPPDARRLIAPAKPRAKGRDVFAYFDNDVKVRAPFDAIALSRRLGIAPPDELPAAPTDAEIARVVGAVAARPRWPSITRPKKPAAKARPAAAARPAGKAKKSPRQTKKPPPARPRAGNRPPAARPNG